MGLIKGVRFGSMQSAASAVVLLIALPLSAIFVGEGVLDRIPNEAIAGVLLALSLFAPPVLVRVRERSADRLPEAAAHRPARAS